MDYSGIEIFSPRSKLIPGGSIPRLARVFSSPSPRSPLRESQAPPKPRCRRRCARRFGRPVASSSSPPAKTAARSIQAPPPTSLDRRLKPPFARSPPPRQALSGAAASAPEVPALRGAHFASSLASLRCHPLAPPPPVPSHSLPWLPFSLAKEQIQMGILV